jgi:poly(3-hydroxybutyrate) depolymerase
MAGSGGSAGSMPTAGSGGISQGGGGTAGAGQSGNGGASGGGGGATVATPSAGCTKATPRPQGGSVTANGEHYFTFPESYDGTKPLPVLVGFHGCAEVNRGTDLESTEWIRLTEGSAFETEYVRAIPVSAATGGCWNYGNDITRVKAMYDELLADYCVDTSRIFATGHSSGAQFIVQILLNSHTADAEHLKFAGVAPVAASDYGAMTGPIPVMYIQGIMDAERGNGDGHETVEKFRAANSCDDASMPYPQVMGCQSDNGAVDPGCIVYEGCDAPTIWCSHNDPAYSGTMHGVPCFGVKAMYDFFQGLK